MAFTYIIISNTEQMSIDVYIFLLLHRNVCAVFTYLFPICSLIYKGELKRSPLLITLYYSILADILCEHRLVKQQWRRTSTIT